MSNMGLYKAFEREGITYIKTDVGDKYVYDAMHQGGYSLGGEESGHIIFSKYASTGDGLITAIKIMDVFIDSKLPSSHLADGMSIYPQITENIRVADKDTVLSDPEVLSARDAVEQKLGDNGRILLRKSGTEPVIRVMCEAEERTLCEESVRTVADIIVEKYRV